MGKIVNKKEFKKWQQLRRKYPYSYDELSSFYRAIVRAYRAIAGRPGIIVAPMRGAEPIVKAIKLIASLEKKSSAIPPVYYPRTGQQVKPSSIVVDKARPDYAKAMSVEEKVREFNKMLAAAKRRSGRNGPAEILVVDEVDKGGSISSTINLIKQVAHARQQAVKVRGIAIAQARKDRMPEYTHLVSQKHVEEFPVRRLFTIDSLDFLRPIIQTKEERSATEGKYAITYEVGLRPKLGVSRAALYNGLELMADLAEMHAHPNPRRSSRLSRLPKSYPRNV